MTRIGTVAAGLLWWTVASTAAPLVITNANVITMNDDKVLAGHAVVVGDGRIEWVGPQQEQPPAGDAEIIDARGAYLMPGLIDAHVHLRDPAEYALYLSAGVTTVVELGGPDHRHWRKALERGAQLGPRLFTCGPTVTADTPDKAPAVVAAHATAGFDCIKIYDDMPSEIFGALVDAADEAGLPSFAHIPRNLGWAEMLTGAPDAVAHAEEFLYSPCCSREDLQRIVDTMAERDIALITTLATYDNIIEQASDLELFLARQPQRYYPPVDFRAWRAPLNRYGRFDPRAPIKLRALFAFQQTLVRHFHEGGVAIVMGTDAGNTGTFPGISVAEELRWLVEAGLQPFDALEAATGAAARLIRKGEELGRIAPGRRADLVLLAGNPLADVSNVRFVRGVMVGGRWVDGDALRGRREAVAVSFEAERELVARVDTAGVDDALSWLRAQDASLRLLALNELAYQKLKVEDRPGDALKLFRANVAMHADHWVPHASLAEGLLATGDREAARKSARRALELAPADSLVKQELTALGLIPDP